MFAIGWLESPHPFPEGDSPSGLLDKLDSLIASSGKHYAAYAFRGQHYCDLGHRRPGGEGTVRETLSHINLWIPGNGVIYLAPALIAHYVEVHRYSPPAGFAEAVLGCPDFGSQAYRTALQLANGGYPPPLKTSEELIAEQAAFLEKLARDRGQA